MDDKNRKKLMDAESEKSIRWKEKVQNKAADWKSRLLVGGAKTENHHESGKHFHGRHKAIKALMVFLIKII